MRKKRSSKLKYLIVITVIISLFYLILYLYSSGHFFIKISCPEEGGTCKFSCSPWEFEGLACSQDNVCCIPFEENTIQLAMEKRDISLCQFITTTIAKKSCELAVLDIMDFDLALNFKDSKYCINIKNPSIKDSCFEESALQTNNKGLCSSISSTETKDVCFLNFVQSGEDKVVCDLISSDFYKERCLKKIAEFTQDISICSQLKIYSEYYDCFSKVDLRKHIPFNAECENLNKEDCKNQKGCKPLIINELKQAVEAYGGCARDEELFCTLTQGSWEDMPNAIMRTIEKGCRCKDNKVHYKGYGCFDCDIFSNENVRKDCKDKL
ncbi:MAG: hypothetical protein KKB39_05240 [Nanoarchaeota archaeon]|nr:hypothetical protein [Nanoarchaeota archaeon]